MFIAAAYTGWGGAAAPERPAADKSALLSPPPPPLETPVRISSPAVFVCGFLVARDGGLPVADSVRPLSALSMVSAESAVTASGPACTTVCRRPRHALWAAAVSSVGVPANASTAVVTRCGVGESGSHKRGCIFSGGCCFGLR